ncbi:hypothetical protein GCM10023088_56530 [Actinomadura verrucosospora]|uniref:hypothetical protein n=1 Tax=Actinomadura verrucosospora TaxID=46165 RepID=UPI0031E834E8
MDVLASAVAWEHPGAAASCCGSEVRAGAEMFPHHRGEWLGDRRQVFTELDEHAFRAVDHRQRFKLRPVARTSFAAPLFALVNDYWSVEPRGAQRSCIRCIIRGST